MAAPELYTSCTACDAVFEITLEQLGLANGAVRCGVCGETFNARESLRESASEAPSGPDDIPPDEAASARADEQHPETPPSPPTQGASERKDAEPPNGDIERSDGSHLGEQLVALDLLDDSIGEDSPMISAGGEERTAEVDSLLLEPRRRPGVVSNIMWGALGLLMLMLAAAQVTLYWRDQWVQVTWLNGPLLALNERLGAPLDFTYDVSRYGFVDRPRLLVDDTTGDGQDATQVLEVRAELANEASVPQPLPHLRLILEDRWGRPVASRTLEPSEYLTQNRSATTFLAPAERVDASARVATQNASPQAYTLDICLPTADRRLNCGEPPPNDNTSLPTEALPITRLLPGRARPLSRISPIALKTPFSSAFTHASTGYTQACTQVIHSAPDDPSTP